MRRFFVPQINTEDKTVIISGSEAKHIIRVLRMSPGDKLILIVSGGDRYQCRILHIAKNTVHLEIEKPLPRPLPGPVEIILCQALLKAQAMDYLMQKSTELGANAIYPFFSERTIVKLEGGRAEAKVRHWKEVARNAVKQSDSLGPPRITIPQSFETLMEKWHLEQCTKIILWEEEASQNLKSVLRRHGRGNRLIGVVGPEGGFSKHEIGVARAAGFIPVSLGRRILRAETAGMIMIALVQYEWGDLGMVA